MQLDQRTVRGKTVAKIRLENLLVSFLFLYCHSRSFPRSNMLLLRDQIVLYLFVSVYKLGANLLLICTRKRKDIFKNDIKNVDRNQWGCGTSEKSSLTRLRCLKNMLPIADVEL